MQSQKREKGHKRQHFVPKSYLAAWTDPSCPPDREPYVWVFPRDGGEPRPRSPAKVCTERDMYTIPMQNGGRDLRIEHGLHSLEDSFARTRREFIGPRKPLPAAPHTKLFAFVVAMQWRTPRARKHIEDQWRGVLELGEELKQRVAQMTPEARRRAVIPALTSQGPAMGMDDVRRIVKQPLQATLASHLRVITPMLARLNTTVLCASGDARFITSDNPCTWFDPEAYKRTPFYRSPALMYPSLEITMPISPDQCLLLSHRHDLNRYVEVGDDLVDELNRRARGYADVEFIAQTSAAKAIWYDEGRPPDDGRAGPSWDEEV